MTEDIRHLLDKVDNALPEQLTAGDVVKICGYIVTQYAADHEDAKSLLMDLARKVVAFYEEMPNLARSCNCPKCAEKRKQMN